MSADYSPALAGEVGKLVKAARRAAGLSQRQLAAKVGVVEGYIGRIEVGDCGTSLAMLYRLAKGLGVRPHDLLPEACQAEKARERAMRAPAVSAYSE